VNKIAGDIFSPQNEDAVEQLIRGEGFVIA
jgi:hypothetical protein